MSLLILNIILGFLIGGAAGYLGTILLSRKTTVMSGPLGHLALPGAALALVYGINMAIGAFPSR
jgi:ABC-type Mn2+/Zn2+ transport system permease subunit